MRDIQHYNFEVRPGLPPDGEPETFFGFDAAGHSYVLRWSASRGGWLGCGFDVRSGMVSENTPFLHFLAKDDMASFITHHAPAPLLRQGTAFA